ncbi:PAS domain S-box protein [Pyxidicoccus fallax]|uniref:histidine kinase n=1 Tax=Pyxidicoccus fallax TaxID=394095 RepID=A0A848LY16_9BACT|nr:ATP-binding protein [Pyxidicoccus fallax]NMO22716.1 PAS domain S-box protein [Pyxidicoccus fallax]NPC86443.1 PAS domain S-box protein [Pyxidicoccus fallax]
MKKAAPEHPKDLALHASILEGMVSAVNLADERGTVIYTNAAEDRLFGYARGELLGQPIRVLSAWSPEEHALRVVEISAEVKAQGLWFGVLHNRRKDGTTFTSRARITPLELGGKQHWLCVRDAQAEEKRHQAEREATENLHRELLHALLGEAPAAIAILRGEDLTFEFANTLHDKVAGRRIPPGTPMVEAMPELLSQPGLLETLRRVLRTGEPFKAEEFSVRLDRHGNGTPEESFFNLAFVPIRDTSGRITGVLTHAVEVTEQVRSRMRVEEAERRLKAITDNATLGLFLMDARQHCVFMNPAAEAITGFTLAEVQGQPLHEFIHHTRPDGTPYPMAECPIDRALPTRAQEQGQDVFVRRDGSFYPVAFTASPLLVEGVPSGTVIELRDTTKENRQAEERERLLRELRQSVRLRDEFLSVAAHELKTPLTPLALRLAQLRRGAQDSYRETRNRERELKNLEVAEAQVHKLAVLVDGLLDVSRLAEGRLSLHLEDVDVADVVREVTRDMEPQATRSPLQVEVESGAVGHLDRVRVAQVVTNLLSNALKFGTGRPVHVRLRIVGRWARLTVSDQGIGIAPELLERIFHRFERGVSERHYGGLGLGLYVTRQLVEAMGGTVKAESTPSRGATFTVDLPLKKS